MIRKLKPQFARHGIPETCMSEKGSLFSFDEFRELSRQWNFKYIKSSPKYPQNNGKVEAAAGVTTNNRSPKATGRTIRSGGTETLPPKEPTEP